MLVAVAGFQHETNTFAPRPATLADFEAPDAWPGLTRGDAIIEAVRGINLPAAGFIEAALADGHSIAPLTWCSATPSGRVTRDAYEHIASLIIEDLGKLRHLDAVYLDLHGAMAAEHVDDADGELLRRVRSAVGSSVPIVASLDFHANVSPLMVSAASALLAFRTYPHVDMSESGARAMRCARALVDRPLARAIQQIDFLIPLTSQCTLAEPLASLMEEALRQERESVLAFNFTPGFPAADVEKCGPAVFGYGTDAADVERAVHIFAERVRAHEGDFSLEIFTIESALHEIARFSAARGRPTILADTQDNPGGGGTSDTTSLIKALMAQHARRVLAGIVCDPLAAAKAHAAGIGREIELELGGHSGPSGESPIHARFTVAALGSGRFTASGPFYLGSRMDLGPMALLRAGDVQVAVSSRKQQAADQAMFRHLGVEPRDFAVVVLKSSVHFRADFGPVAGRILVVAAPGLNTADPAALDFRNLRHGMRVAGR